MSARALAAAIVLAIAHSSAHADPAKPWEEGTTQSQRDEAHKLFTVGNNHYVQRRYPQALEQYHAALAIFDHPRIRLGVVRTLVWLGKPAEAHEHVVAALQFGAQPFDADEHQEAVDVRGSLERQLGAVVIRCQIEGAAVTLDGTDVLTCPGEVTRFVAPGRHQIVGSKSGHLTMTREVIAEAGRHRSAEDTVSIELPTMGAATGTRRRWATWKPWSVVGGGAAVAAIGGLYLYRAQANFDEAESLVGQVCPAPCEEGNSLLDRARVQQNVARVLVGVGGAGIMTGLVLVYFNRKESVATSAEAPAVSVTPLITGGELGLAVGGRF